MTPALQVPSETIAKEATEILKSLLGESSSGASRDLGDVRTSLSKSVSLDFDSYIFFLRKYDYVSVGSDNRIKPLPRASEVVHGSVPGKLEDEVNQFFSSNPSEGRSTNPPAEKKTELLMSAPISSAPLQVGSTAFSGKRGGDESVANFGPRYGKAQKFGSGPLGNVYKAKHHALDLEVCIKEIKDVFGFFSFLQRGEVVRRFKQGICAQAQIRHPSVVTLLDQNEEAERPYIVMELASTNLRGALQASGGKGLQASTAIRYFLQLAYGLQAAHSKGVSHCNLKPENVLIDSLGNAKLADFGFSSIISVDPSQGIPQIFLGTEGFSYLSPEALARSKPIGPESDIYGLGILLYEMISGHVPGRRSPSLKKVQSDLPEWTDAVFETMTQDRLEDRYANMDAVLSATYEGNGDPRWLSRGAMILNGELEREQTTSPAMQAPQGDDGQENAAKQSKGRKQSH